MWQLINHLSWPEGNSTNDGIPDEEGSIKYKSFKSAICLVCCSGQGSLLAKLDLKDAFRNIPVCLHNWHLWGFHWNAHIYCAIVLMFGIMMVPYIFNLFAETLHGIIIWHIPGEFHHYLDNFLLVFPPSTSLTMTNNTLAWCQGLGSQLRLYFATKKTVAPWTSLEYLSLELDTFVVEAHLPSDKLIFLWDLLNSWLSKHTASLHEVQELIGFLQFASQVILHSCTFSSGGSSNFQ